MKKDNKRDRRNGHGAGLYKEGGKRNGRKRITYTNTAVGILFWSTVSTDIAPVSAVPTRGVNIFWKPCAVHNLFIYTEHIVYLYM